MASDRHKKKMATGDLIFNVIIYTFLALVVIVTLFPFINNLAYSFSNKYSAVAGGIHLLPRKWTLDNYIVLLKDYPGVRRGLRTSLLRTLLATPVSLAVNALLAFILSRKKYLFKSGFALFWVITMYLQGGIVPTYILYRNLKLTGSFLVYVIPGLVNVLYVLVLRTYMKNLPESLEETAQLEGAGYFRIFTCIVSPLCKPVYAAIALFIAVYHWNSWFDALLYNRLVAELTTVNFEIMKFLSELRHNQIIDYTIKCRTTTPHTIRSAAIVLAVLPLMTAFPFFQKYFVAGLTVGGIKD